MSQLTFGLSVGAVGILVVFSGLVILILCLKVMELLFKDRKKKLPAAKAEAPDRRLTGAAPQPNRGSPPR